MGPATSEEDKEETPRTGDVIREEGGEGEYEEADEGAILRPRLHAKITGTRPRISHFTSLLSEKQTHKHPTAKQ